MGDSVGLGLSNVGVGGWVVVGVEIGRGSGSHCRDSRGSDLNSSWLSRHGLRGWRNHLTLLRGSKGSSFGGSISCGKLCLGSCNLLSIGQV